MGKVQEINNRIINGLELEIELLKAENGLLRAKWEAQGLMIQKLHLECKVLKDTLSDIATVDEINSYDHAIFIANETLESLEKGGGEHKQT